MSGESGGHGRTEDLGPAARTILNRGMAELLRLAEGLEFKPMNSDRHPLPLSLAVYGRVPAPDEVRDQVCARMGSDPVAALLPALVLLELHAGHQPGIAPAIPEDPGFLSQAFDSKRMNGWLSVIGDADRKAVKDAVGRRWQFRMVQGPDRRTGVYALLNVLCRYAVVYGRIPPGDSHALGHFIEDFGQGVVVGAGRLDDLELTLSLAAMKLGVPAVVPPDYPFPLGRRITAGTMDEIADAVVAFPTVRRLLDFPDIPGLPDYLDDRHAREAFQQSTVWGETLGSFLVLRRGPVARPGVEVTGDPAGPLGVILTADADPLDAFDREYIEGEAVGALSMIHGVRAERDGGRLLVRLAGDVALPPDRIGEVLVAAIRHEFPKIARVRAEVIFDQGRLASVAPGIRSELEARRYEMETATEESIPRIVTCTGCSPFAPDHVCIVTHESPPQCGRPYGMIKTGGLYGYDDMTNIHHRALHAGMNSFGTTEKGDLLDPVAGEWSGVNAAASRLTGGRTTRIQLHRLDIAPRTGCGCFGLIMFTTERPRKGIGIMHRGWDGRAPDGRSWWDLHYALAGKQAPGLAGASDGYLFSRRFLAAHGGWKDVVWVSPRVAKIAGDRLPPAVQVG